MVGKLNTDWAATNDTEVNKIVSYVIRIAKNLKKIEDREKVTAKEVAQVKTFMKYR